MLRAAKSIHLLTAARRNPASLVNECVSRKALPPNVCPICGLDFMSPSNGRSCHPVVVALESFLQEGKLSRRKRIQLEHFVEEQWSFAENVFDGFLDEGCFDASVIPRNLAMRLGIPAYYLLVQAAAEVLDRANAQHTSFEGIQPMSEDWSLMLLDLARQGSIDWPRSAP